MVIDEFSKTNKSIGNQFVIFKKVSGQINQSFIKGMIILSVVFNCDIIMLTSKQATQQTPKNNKSGKLRKWQFNWLKTEWSNEYSVI